MIHITYVCSWMTWDCVTLRLVDSFQSINHSTTSAFVMRSEWTKALFSQCFSLRIIHKFLWYWRVLMTAALKRLFNWGYWSFLCNIGNQIIQKLEHKNYKASSFYLAPERSHNWCRNLVYLSHWPRPCCSQHKSSLPGKISNLGNKNVCQTSLENLDFGLFWPQLEKKKELPGRQKQTHFRRSVHTQTQNGDMHFESTTTFKWQWACCLID